MTPGQRENVVAKVKMIATLLGPEEGGIFQAEALEWVNAPNAGFATQCHINFWQHRQYHR
jgi:hypothetical protein